LKRGIGAIGYGAHIVYSCVQSIYDTLPIGVEALVVKIYDKYFHAYTLSGIELQPFCNKTGIENTTLLHNVSTGFVSLLPVTGSLNETYERLEAYFISQPKC
jgi:hypothetical protein